MYVFFMSCWVMVDPPSWMERVFAFSTAARPLASKSRPRCSSKRRASIARTPPLRGVGLPVLDRGAADGFEVEAPVLLEAVVLDGDDGLPERRVYVVEADH